MRESSDEKLEMESDGRRSRSAAQRSEFQLPSENPDEFPVVAAFEEEKYHEMPARFFRETIRRTVFATDNESSRYALGGVLIELTGTRLRRWRPTAAAWRQGGPAKAVGAHQSGDTHDDHSHAGPCNCGAGLADNDENIQLAARDNDVLVKSGRATIYSRLVEGRFPKWRNVFPAGEQPAVELTAGPFYAAVRQAAIVTSEESRGVDFTFGEGKVVLAAHGAEYGESHIELPIAYDGAAGGHHPRYLEQIVTVRPLLPFTISNSNFSKHRQHFKKLE